MNEEEKKATVSTKIFELLDKFYDAGFEPTRILISPRIHDILAPNAHTRITQLFELPVEIKEKCGGISFLFECEL